MVSGQAGWLKAGTGLIQAIFYVAELTDLRLLQDLASALISRGSDSQESVVGPVIDWESKFCATSGCQPEIIEQALHTVQSTCKTDLEKGNVIPRIAVGALKRGTLVTDLFCVADKNKKAQDYCFRKILGDLEVRAGRLSVAGALLNWSINSKLRMIECAKYSPPASCQLYWPIP